MSGTMLVPFHAHNIRLAGGGGGGQQVCMINSMHAHLE